MTPPRPFSSDWIRRLALVLATIGTLFSVRPAMAGQLQIMPTRLGLSSATPSTVLYATNADAGDATYQLSVFSWSQLPDGSDKLDQTREVLANPAIFSIAHADQQVIRFGLRTDSQPAERAYRVILQELPRPDQQVTGIRTLLRISIPLFVPATRPAPAMRWALQPSPKGAKLIARNIGNVHVQIVSVEIEGPSAKAMPAPMKCNIYVLPGMTHEIPVSGASALATGTTYHVRITTDQGQMTADLRADPAATPPGD